MKMIWKPALTAVCLSVSFAACVDNPDANGDPEVTVRDDVHDIIEQKLTAFVTATTALKDAAPTHAWDAPTDAAAINSMKAHWGEARASYEQVEGAIAVLFPDLDVSTDQRYDFFIALGADANGFDDQGVIGIHAIERIVFSDAVPASVVTFEEGLPGYEVARFPQRDTEATDFKTKLAARLVTDVTQMHDEFDSLDLDTAAAYRGVIGSIQEQLEKVNLAGTGEDESRYAQHTLADMRANLDGGRAILDAFRPVLESKEGGDEILANLDASFARVKAKYDSIEGDAIPEVPAGWNPDAPTPEQVATPYGQLFTFLTSEVQPNDNASLVSLMLRSAAALNIPEQ